MVIPDIFTPCAGASWKGVFGSVVRRGLSDHNGPYYIIADSQILVKRLHFGRKGQLIFFLITITSLSHQIKQRSTYFQRVVTDRYHCKTVSPVPTPKTDDSRGFANKYPVVLHYIDHGHPGNIVYDKAQKFRGACMLTNGTPEFPVNFEISH